MKKHIRTNVPQHEPIELITYYDELAWYYLECELATKKWFVENVESDWCIIDCGANIGYYSILFARLAPEGHIYAIEPTNTIEHLKANLAFHNTNNVSVHQFAMGMKSGRYEEKIFRIWGQPAEHQEYDFITVDDFVSNNKIDRLDCIKIDVDSFDFEVLQGAEKTLESFDPYIVVELNHALTVRGQTPAQALEWLVSRGYRKALVLDNENFILKRCMSITTSIESNKSLEIYFP